MSPRVGVTVCIDRGKRWRPGYDYLYVNRAYARRLAEAGASVVLLSLDTPVATCIELCDAIVLTGGDDLPTSRAELDAWTSGVSGGFEAPQESLGLEPGPLDRQSGFRTQQQNDAPDTLGAAEDVERMAWERGLLDAASVIAMPVLGICYGMQLMNVHFGGILYRDLRAQHHRAVDHGGSGSVTEHGLRRVGESRLLGGLPERLTVNSCHGQAVDLLAPGFVLTALAEDGVIEAMERDNLFGIEWHPETDPSGPPVFERFVELVSKT